MKVKSSHLFFVLLSSLVGAGMGHADGVPHSEIECRDQDGRFVLSGGPRPPDDKTCGLLAGTAGTTVERKVTCRKKLTCSGGVNCDGTAFKDEKVVTDFHVARYRCKLKDVATSGIFRDWRWVWTEVCEYKEVHSISGCHEENRLCYGGRCAPPLFVTQNRLGEEQVDIFNTCGTSHLPLVPSPGFEYLPLEKEATESAEPLDLNAGFAEGDALSLDLFESVNAQSLKACTEIVNLN
jgi:hypothetical protein